MFDRLRSLLRLCMGALSCVKYRGWRLRQVAKPSEQMIGKPNNCSVRRLPTSRERYGRKTQLQTSRRPLAAVSEQRNFILRVAGIGQAMR